MNSKTNFERVKEMSIDEMAESFVYELRIFILGDPKYMSTLDCTCYDTRELAIRHNKDFLSQEVEIETSQ